MDFLNYDDFTKLIELDPDYYRKRWSYYCDVMHVLTKTGVKFKKVLELGPYLKPLIKNSDTIDNVDRGKTTFVFDASSVDNWKCIPDGSYDLFIGMQVLEHLSNQEKVWQEIKRVAKYALITLPYRWVCPGDCHHGITSEVIRGWTDAVPEHCLISGRDKQCRARRIICFYDLGEK